MLILNKFKMIEAQDHHVPAIRQLVNAAYKELSDMGLNDTATYQDEEKTRERMKEGKTFILLEEDRIIATILYFKKNEITKKDTVYVGQFGVSPEYKRMGLGSIMMDHCENLARKEGYEAIQLDTAKPATHLVNWYLKRGYEVVGSTRWEGKTYESYIFEKPLK